MAPGQGFEPQLPGPEPGVLPLDDPGTGHLACAIIAIFARSVNPTNADPSQDIISRMIPMAHPTKPAILRLNFRS
jgi:hypothetical protein